ncbi:SusC/RagA family TonB-linked outer membrane protein [uncultured Fibrella sp.]|uniref:SusC/RagA family TonB-linked outer membrane protein n=1 Tax=uncultured Fibrella sp. TaxID=1284596 RepID=UPI0035C9E535
MRSKLLQITYMSMVLFLIGISTFAQNRRVNGRVTGPDGGLPGINVVIKGTSTGTSTDANGGYSLNLRGNSDVLVFSGIGFKSQEVAVGNKTSVDVSMSEDASVLNEVIVTGYTSETRKDLTGAVSSVKSRDLTVAPSGNVEQLFQGRVAGVTVITNGQPGTNSLVRIRGFGSFDGNQPLYVVDGVPISDNGNGINFLSPDDIERTDILKDASTASIYGARAAGGVINITTKRGTRNAKKLTVTYDGFFGVTTPGTGQPILNPQQQADWSWQARKNDIFQAGGSIKPDSFTGIAGGQYGQGQTPVLPTYINVGGVAGVSGAVDLAAERLKYNVDRNAGNVYQVVEANKAGTNWYEAITRNAPLIRNTIGISGGGENSRFYIGFSQQNQAGILKNNDFTRYTFRANTEFNILKNLRLGENLQFTYRSALGQGGGNNGQNVPQDENDILQAFRMPPIIPVYDVFGGYAGTAAKGFNNPRNPVASRDGQVNDRNFNGNAFGNLYLEFDPIPNLTLRSSIGGQFNSGYYNYYQRLQYENSENNSSFGYGEGSGYSLSWTLTNTANYRRQFGVHTVDILAGQEALNTGSGRGIDGFGINPFSTDPNFVTLGTVQGTGKQVNSGYGLGTNFSSIFGRLNYSYRDKYSITGVIRRDGSSRFAPEYRYGVFPAVSAGWTISSEPFMKNIPAITFLRLHAGYGAMGNSNNVNPNNQFSLYASSIDRGYDLTGSKSSVVGGITRSRIGNPLAKWETAVTADIGLDATLFNGKLEVAVSVWRKTTKDLLIQVPLPAVVGVTASAPSVNVAEMQNQGIDLQISNKGVLTGALKYELVFNGSFLSNTVKSLAPGVANIQPANFRNISPVQIQPGLPISSFYGYQVVGLFGNKAEVDGAAKQDGAAPGRFRYADINGDGQITADDRTFLGSPVPSFTGGITMVLRYKGFDLTANLYSSLGGKIYNFSKWYTDFYPSFTGAAVSARVLNSWLPTNTNTDTPIFENTSNFSTNTVSNSFYVESGDYLRLQNVTLGYSLPPTSRLARLRFFVQSTNLFTVTGYKGLDPAVGGSADTNFGIDVGNYPVTRGFNGGIGLTF